MKKIYLLFIFCNFQSLYAQEIFIQNQITKSPIKNVAVFSTNKIRSAISDNFGKCNLNIFNKGDTLNFQHIAYIPVKTSISQISRGGVFYLTPKNTLLDEVLLRTNRKSSFQKSSQILSINRKKIIQTQSANTGDLLQKSVGINIQKSQVGGGSPNLRGMEANRILLVLDGIKMNNMIYRSGHLQNIMTVDPFILNKIGIANGLSSVAYGSGALGGAILIETIKPLKSDSSDFFFSQQIESASDAVIGHFHAKYGKNKFYFLSGLTFKSFGNSKMGKTRLHSYQNWGNEAVATNGNEQLFTAYKQADFIHKTDITLSKEMLLSLNTQYSYSSDINRFDMLNDDIKYSDWYYGPQKRFMQILAIKTDNSHFLFDNSTLTFSFQNIEESRHKSSWNSSVFTRRFEKVSIYDLIFDFEKTLVEFTLNYGIEGRKENLHSTAYRQNGNFGKKVYATTRYPDGGSGSDDFSFYSLLSKSISYNLSLSGGLRYSANKLNAIFNDTSAYHLPFNNITLNNSSFSSSINIKYTPKNWSFISSISNSFRNPNMDDIGKVFSKNDKWVVVPNSKLTPEKALTIDGEIRKFINDQLEFKLLLFQTLLVDAIERRDVVFNGADSLVYDGVMMKTQSNQNIGKAKISGISFSLLYNITKRIRFSSIGNYTKGETAKNLPLAHIPPFNVNTFLEYNITKNKSLVFYVFYNAWKKKADFDIAGVDNLDEATLDGTPSWTTFNLKYLHKIDDSVSFSVAIENISDIHYKTFASGISANGRNLILSLQSNF
jgi:hemoglobin/transferrin/lactoferrin receptor protein